MRLISYLKSPIDHRSSGRREYVTVQGIGKLKAAFKGVLTFYSWIEGVAEGGFTRNDFVMSQTSPVEYFDPEGGSVEFEVQFSFPCSGIVTGAGEGYIISPAIKIEPVKPPSIVVMLLAPRTAPYVVATETNILAIPNNESAVMVDTNNGELHCSGNILGKAKSARIIMNRNPGLPFYRAGFNETLSAIKGPGRISADWRPAARSFEELAIAFHASQIQPLKSDALNFDNLAHHLGVPETSSTRKPEDFIIGDGAGVRYTLRLRLDHGLGRHESHEVPVLVS